MRSSKPPRPARPRGDPGRNAAGRAYAAARDSPATATRSDVLATGWQRADRPTSTELVLERRAGARGRDDRLLRRGAALGERPGGAGGPAREAAQLPARRRVLLRGPAGRCSRLRPRRAVGGHPDRVRLGRRSGGAGQDRPAQPDLRRGPARRRAGREDLGRRPAARRRGGRVPRRRRRPARHRGRLRARSADAGSACWSTIWCPGSKESRIADQVRRGPGAASTCWCSAIRTSTSGRR